MKTLWRWLSYSLAALFATASLAQAPAPQGDSPRFSQAELDSMLAPVALYPDSLLSQLLIAATYPRDVSEAAAWSRANPNLSGEEAVRAVGNPPWDPSVKSLVAFPQVLAMMDEQLGWTERLGDAFMTNPGQVSDTIQALRGRADQAGNLRSSEEAVVRRDYGSYVIEPAAPEVVYVPYYDPNVAYGNWWWPESPPMYWAPWPGYAWASGFAWGYAVAVGPGFWYAGFDWPHRYVRFHNHRPWYYRGHSRSYDHRWYSNDHRRNVRGWQWQGNRDGRGSGNGRGAGNGRGTNDGRGLGRRESNRNPSPEAVRAAGRAVSPSGVAPQAGAEQTQRRGSTRVLPAAPAQRGYGNSQSLGRIEPQLEPRSVAPRANEQPLSRGALGMPVQTAPVQSLSPIQRAPAQAQHAPVQQRAPAQHAPVEQRAPAQHAAPAARAPSPIAREPVERSESRSESRAPERSEPAGRSGGGGGGIGRIGGGRQ